MRLTYLRASLTFAMAVAFSFAFVPNCFGQYVVTFTKMYVADDAEAGSGDWRLKGYVDTLRDLDLINFREAGTGGTLNINKFYRVRSLPVRIECKAWEYDRPVIGTAGWDYAGSASRFIANPGSYSMRIRGSEGTLFVYFTVARDQLAPASGLVEVFRRQSSLGPNALSGQGYYYQAYNVSLIGGRTYTIDMSSSEFDTKLLLKNSAGNVIRVDDDSGPGLNSRIRFQPVSTATYRIIATSYLKGARGNFNLTVRR